MATSSIAQEFSTPAGSAIDDNPNRPTTSAHADNDAHRLSSRLANGEPIFNGEKIAARKKAGCELLGSWPEFRSADEASYQWNSDREAHSASTSSSSAEKEAKEISSLSYPSATPRPTNFYDLPPELTSAIINLVLSNERDSYDELYPWSRYTSFNVDPFSSATPAICQVNKRLRHEGLALHFGHTQFNGCFIEHDEYGEPCQFERERWLRRGRLPNARAWMSAVGEENLQLLRRLSLSGWPSSMYPGWYCDINFRKGTLTTSHLNGKGMEMRCWIIKRAFEHITGAKAWRPTEEGLSAIFEVFVVSQRSHRKEGGKQSRVRSLLHALGYTTMMRELRS